MKSKYFNIVAYFKQQLKTLTQTPNVNKKTKQKQMQ